MSSVAVSAEIAASPRTRSHVDLVLVAVTFATLWFILCRHLSGEWSVNEQYNYGWFVPIFAAYLFWLRWETRPLGALEDGRVKGQRLTRLMAWSVVQWSVVLAAAAMLALLLPLRVFEIGNPDWRPLGWVHTSIVAGLTLIYIWSVGGKPWLRHFAFPVAFFFVAVPWVTPIEGPIVQGLMRIVAAVATEVLTLFGIPAQLEGNLIRVSTGVVGVNEACSGVRSLQTSLMIGLLFGELKRLSILRRIVLVAGAVAIALIANFLRAFFLVWISATKSLPDANRWHDIAGYGIVAAVFLGTLGFAALLRRNKPGGQMSEDRGAHATRVLISATRRSSAETANQQSAISDQQSAGPLSLFTSHLSPFTFLFILVWLVLVELAAAGWYRAHEKNLTPTARWDVQWPESAPEFREIPISDGVRATLRFDKGREVTWREAAAPNEEATCLLFFFRWEPGTSTILRARAHRPDICLPSAGWQQIADEGMRRYDATASFALPFRHFTFRRDVVRNQRPVFAHTFFCLREDVVRGHDENNDALLNSKRPGTWERQDRWRVVREGIRNPGQQVMELVMVSPRQISPAEAQQQFAALLPKLIRVTSDQ